MKIATLWLGLIAGISGALPVVPRAVDSGSGVNNGIVIGSIATLEPNIVIGSRSINKLDSLSPNDDPTQPLPWKRSSEQLQPHDGFLPQPNEDKPQPIPWKRSIEQVDSLASPPTIKPQPIPWINVRRSASITQVDDENNGNKNPNPQASVSLP